MARTQKSSVNRHKKSGKGKNALAVFLVLVLLFLVAAYYFFSWQPEKQPDSPKKPVPANRSAAAPEQRMPQSPSLPGVNNEPSPKSPGAGWEHYTDDTGQEQLPRKAVEGGQGRAELAIIVDDMGASINEARSLLAIGVPITFSVIPGLRYDSEVASIVSAQGGEVMIHMPMQSKEYPRRRLESNGLLLSHDDKELQALVNGYFERIPNAVGANNHTGSAFTEDAARMRVVLGLLKSKGLFFIDSVTTPTTTGPRVASELRMKNARRDIFLDNEQDEAYIQGQLEKAVTRAKRTGRAIAICHPHPVTIAALTRLLTVLKQNESVRFVTASKLVR